MKEEKLDSRIYDPSVGEQGWAALGRESIFFCEWCLRTAGIVNASKKFKSNRRTTSLVTRLSLKKSG